MRNIFLPFLRQHNNISTYLSARGAALRLVKIEDIVKHQIKPMTIVKYNILLFLKMNIFNFKYVVLGIYASVVTTSRPAQCY